MEINEELIRKIVATIVENTATGLAAASKRTDAAGNYLIAAQASPTIFGEGALQTVGLRAKELGCSRVLLVTDAGIVRLGLADTVKNLLLAAGLQVVVFDKVRPNPLDSDCNAGGQLALAERVDGIVALGGGSVMDSGKAIKILTANPLPISQYYGTLSYRPGVPLILIPTTAGTGSEATKYAVLTDAATHAKKVALATGELAICDPEVTYQLPPGLTAATGMDVFAHACESLAGSVHNPKADLLAREAVAKISKWLPVAFAEGSNKTARREVMLACNFAGMAFNDTLCHLGHAAAHSIGATFNIPHGIACAWVLPETMVFCAEVHPERVRMIADAMGLEYDPYSTSQELGKLTAAAIRDIVRKIEIKSVAASGISREALQDVSGLVMTDFCYPYIPRAVTETEVKDFLGRVYDTYQ